MFRRGFWVLLPPRSPRKHAVAAGPLPAVLRQPGFTGGLSFHKSVVAATWTAALRADLQPAGGGASGSGDGLCSASTDRTGSGRTTPAWWGGAGLRGGGAKATKAPSQEQRQKAQAQARLRGG